MLTRKQRDLLLFINDFINENGVSPSFDEMKEALHLKSKSGIHRLINALVERGFLERLPHKARALEVLKKPQNMIDDPPVKGTFEPRVVDGTFAAGRSADKVSTDPEEMVGLPFYGKIAAGTPCPLTSTTYRPM